MTAIIDFHVHAGQFDLLRDDIQGLIRKFPVEPDIDVTEVFSQPPRMEAYLRRNHVVKAVVLAECGPGTNFSIDSNMIARYTQNNPFFVPFGSINPNYHDPLKEWEHSRDIGIKGFKFYPADHDFHGLRDDMMEVYRRCEQAGMPIMFHTGLTAQREASQQFIQPIEFAPIIEACPDLVLIFAHAGKPHWYEQAFDLMRSYPNVYADTALLDPQPFFKQIEADPRLQSKVLFGSDWPVVGSYAALRDRYEQLEVDPQLLRRVLYDNAAALLASLPTTTTRLAA